MAEIPERRTDTATHYRMSDGTNRAVIYSAPIRFKDAKGRWTDIDPNAVLSENLSDYRTAATSIPVTFRDPVGTESTLRLEGEGWTYESDLLGRDIGPRSVVGSRVRYRDVADGVDLDYEANGEGVKEILVLRSSAAPASYTFRLSFAGLELRQLPTRAWALFQPGRSIPALTLGGITAFDSADTTPGAVPSFAPDPRMEVKPIEGGALVTYSVPREWLSDPARVFPVKIDPSVSYNPSKDAFITDVNQTANYGSLYYLMSGYLQPASGHNRALLDFDLSSLTGARIDNATLYMYLYYHNSASSILYLSHLTASWSESSVNWNQMRYSYVTDQSQTVTGNNKWVGWNVASTVQGWVNNPSTQYGFQVLQSEGGSQDGPAFKKWYSKENATNKPYITIGYVGVPDPITNLTASTNRGLEWWRASDRDNDGSPDKLDDAARQGRGAVTLSWTKPARATNALSAGYKIMMFDGYDYRQVGKVLDADITTWTSEGLGIYPIDTEVSSIATGYTGDALYRAATPSSPDYSFQLPSEVETGAGVIVTDGSYLYVRRFNNYPGPLKWRKVGSGFGGTVSGQDYGSVGTTQTHGILSAFYLDGFIYQGYADSSTTISGIWKGSSDTATQTKTLTFSKALIARSTGAELTGASGDLLLASDGERIYSASYQRSGGTYNGFRVREYDRDGTWLGDHDVGISSFYTNGLLADGNALYLLEWKGTDAARVAKVRLSDWKIANRWTHGQSNRAIGGTYDAANNVFWLGRLDGTGTIYRYKGPGLDLRDNPKPLYARMGAGTYKDYTNYWFIVVPYNSFGERALYDNSAYMPTLPNRTIGVNDDARHATYELGGVVDHDAVVELDKGRLAFDVTDLAISSWGPAAALSRSYSSGNIASSRFAPGWRFNFEQSIETSTTTYIDPSGERRRFLYDSSAAAYFGPVGNYQSLSTTSTIPGVWWVLMDKDRSFLGFDSSGRLVAERDANGQQTTYDWNVPNQLTITAANGQYILVAFDGTGRATSATYYATPSDTRRVDYDAGARTVTSFPATSDERTVVYGYDALLRLSSVSVPAFSGAGVSALWGFGYDASSRIATEQLPGWTDGSDLRTNIAYEASAATVTRRGQVDGAAETISQRFTWNPTNTMSSRTNPKISSDATATWNYEYSPTNEEIVETSPLGKTTSRQIDARGNLLYEWDEDGHRTRYVYDSADRLIRRTDPRGSTSYYAYDAAGNKTLEERVLTPDGQRSRESWEYDASTGLTTKDTKTISATETAVTRYEQFAASGEPQKVTNLAVKLSATLTTDLVETKSYDSFGNLVWAKNAAGEWTQKSATYSASGRILTSTDASDTVTRRGYDMLGNEIETSRTAGDDRSVFADWKRKDIDPSGLVRLETVYITQAGAIDHTVSSTYDAMGRLLQETNSVSGTTTKRYDAVGSVRSEWAAGTDTQDSIASTRYTYDAEGRELTRTDPGNTMEAVQTEYNADGTERRVTQADGSWVEYARDDGGNRTAETRPTESGGSAVTTTTYDVGGRATSVTKPDGATTTNAYDLLDRLVGASAEGSGSATTVYNSLGWVISEREADGVLREKTYDAAGRVAAETIKAAGKPDATTTSIYDATGRLLRQSNPATATLGYSYDLLGRQSRETHSLGSSVTKDVEREFDAQSRETSSTDTIRDIRRITTYAADGIPKSTSTLAFAGTTVTVTYDAQGREERRVAQDGDLTTTLTVSARDDQQRPTDWGWDSGYPGFWRDPLTRKTSYDAAGKITGVGGYGWDFWGSTTTGYHPETARETTEVENPALIELLHSYYSYTPEGRLATATFDGYSFMDHAGTTVESYEYDLQGNITKAGDLSLSYNGVSQVTTTYAPGAGTTTYSYDSRGRRVQAISTEASITYEWDNADRLSGYRRDDGRNGSTDVTAAFTYDAAGQRTHTSLVTTSSSIETTYTYDGLQLLKVESLEGTRTQSVSYLYDEAGRPYAAFYTSPLGYRVLVGVATNTRGDVVDLVPVDGQRAIAYYEYDPFGKPHKDGDSEAFIAYVSEDLMPGDTWRVGEFQPLRYAGYAYDSFSGLYYLSARYYDPATMQFISKDPAKADGEESAYQYCAGNPIGRTDPTGLVIDDAFRQYNKTVRPYGQAYADYLRTRAKKKRPKDVTIDFTSLLIGHAAQAGRQRRLSGKGPLLDGWFLWKVRPYGAWDLKRQKRWKGRFKFRGVTVDGGDLGNINFGFVAAELQYGYGDMLGPGGLLHRKGIEPPEDTYMILWGAKLHKRILKR